MPSNIILNTVQDDSNSIVQNEKYLQLFLQLATRAADNLIRLRNQADKNHDCNKSRDNLLSTIEKPRIQPALEANSEQFGETQNETQSYLFSSNSENTSYDAVVHDDEVSNFGTQKSVFNSDTEEETTSTNESNPDVQSSENSTEIDGIAERFFNSFNLQNINASASINDSSDRFKNKFFSQTSNLARPTLERSEQLYNKTDRTSSDAVEHNEDEVSTTSQKSIFEHSDTKNATTKGSDSNSDAQKNSENSEVDEIGERFFNPFNLQTPHALINDLRNTGNKVLAQKHNLLQSTLKKNKQVNNTLCLQKPSSKLDDTSDILDLPLDKLRENILNPQVTNSPSVLHQIVSSAINVVNSVIEKLPASFSNATLFKQIIPHNLEKLRASLNNDTNLFDQIIPHNFTNTPLQIAEEISEDISKSGLEFISALRSRVNEFSSRDNQNVESKSEVTDAGKTNALERDNQKINTELLFTNNSKIQSNNDQSTTVNHESTLAPLSKVLSNSDDHKEHTDNSNGAQNDLQNSSENVNNVEIPEPKEDNPSNITKNRF